MPTCLANKIDSNVTGLRFAEEDCLGELPPAPVWTPMEPNSYSDFGGEVTTIARTPINPSRQRKKGVVTDVNASAGLNQDLTQTNIQQLMQGYLYADIRSKGKSKFQASRVAAVTCSAAGLFTLVAHGFARGDGPFEFSTTTTLPTGMAAATPYWAIPVSVDTFRIATSRPNAMADTSISPVGPGTGVHTLTTGNASAAGGYRVNNPAGFSVGDVVFARGFTLAANNGRKVVSAVTGPLIAVDGTGVIEVGNVNAAITVVGRNGASGDLRIDVTASLPRLMSTVLDFTTLGIIPGEWIFIGGDDVNSSFANTVNNGFKRVRSVAAQAITLDKSTSPMVADLGTGMTIQLFFGEVLKNETGALIKRRSYQLERTVGSLDGIDPPQSEYIIGAVPSELAFNMATADKLMLDLTFMALDAEHRTQAEGLKVGLRPDLVEADAFNTSTTMKRFTLGLAGTTDEAATPLFGFATEASFSINNTLSANKALGKVGAFEITAGTFQVSGSLEAYFSDIDAVKAIRNNADVTLDSIFVQNNAGIIIDIPLITLGDGRLNVELDQPIMLPLSIEAGASKKVNPETDHTILFMFFDYLPNMAAI